MITSDPGGNEGKVQIDLDEACRIFREITGRRRSPADLAFELEPYPYMTISALGGHGDCLKVIGVWRHRWIYFLKARAALYGPRRVFDCYEGYFAL
jgi:hypothetical protein